VEYGDLIVDSIFTLTAVGFGLIGLFITHTIGDGSIGILTTTMDGIDLTVLGTLLITKIYGVLLEEIVI